MHSALGLSALFIAATSALALPQTTTANVTTSSASSAGQETSVRVILQNQASELGSQTVFKSVNHRKHKSPVGSSGPFTTIEINVGADANEALRCQALGTDGLPLVAYRGANTDITFSDADNGEWTFRDGEVEVSRIICDPAFVAAPKEDSEVRVIPSGPSELATQTVFQPVVADSAPIRVESPPTGSSGPYDTVEIALGPLVDPDLRCQLLDGRGRKIVATRGENTDVTFSDADKGSWAFDRQRRVTNVICDPEFVADPQ